MTACGPPPESPSTPALSAYAWHQLDDPDQAADLVAALTTWAVHGGTKVVVDVSFFADISEIPEPEMREAAYRRAQGALGEVVDAAAALGMEVGVLAGNPNWFSEERFYVMPLVIDAVLDFNDNHSRGVVSFEVDVEPWASGPDWDLRSYLKGLEVLLDHSLGDPGGDVSLGVAVPYWLDEMRNAASPAGEDPFQTLVTLMARLPGSYVTVMDYRDYVDGTGGILESVSREFEIAADSTVDVVVALDLMPGSEPGSTLNGLPWPAVEEAIAAVADRYEGSGRLQAVQLNDISTITQESSYHMGLPPVWLTLGVGGSQAASAAV